MYWNCHDHRDELKISDACTIYHPEQGQLCYGERHWDCILFFPITFKDKQKAQEWIDDGCIAQIQESFGNLNIAFTKNCFIEKAQPWERD